MLTPQIKEKKPMIQNYELNAPKKENITFRNQNTLSFNNNKLSRNNRIQTNISSLMNSLTVKTNKDIINKTHISRGDIDYSTKIKSLTIYLKKLDPSQLDEGYL